ncbi:MAG: ACT domain-containing protein [Opitutae bacterium]|nr:ACT domain-containing protein [Opitutae bacterium]
MPLVIQLLPGEFAIARLPADAAIPDWVKSPVFSATTRTADELSILCPAALIPPDVKHEAGWRLFKLRGPFAFTETGILSSVLDPLAFSRISILAHSTFDTDYVLVKQAQVDDAVRTLRHANHTVERL